MFLNKDMEKKYVIINKEYVNSVDFQKVIETSEATLRYNLDGTKTIIKFIGEVPSFLDGDKIYSHDEIIETINNPDNGWIDTNE
tara:strand:- start:15742 stop:15993 length:252 start_codon:yes stop_codon:yes gene_type:complete